MKALKIQILESKSNKVLQTLIAARLDATKCITVISESLSLTEKSTVRLPYGIDHWNIIEGMITIYYKNGLIMEVTRVNRFHD